MFSPQLRSAFRWLIVVSCSFIISALMPVAAASADWDPGDGHKMHFPQEPDPEGWDICLVDQWLADDFQCTESGPIQDIHFWISWREGFVGDVPDAAWEIDIFDDAGGVPGNLVWQLAPGQATIHVRQHGNGPQGWHCPAFQVVLPPPDHFEFFQVNITNIQEPFFQTEGMIYWLVIRASIPGLPGPVVGWKTSLNFPPTQPFGAPALWTTDLVNWQPIETPFFPEFFLHDLAFVITNTGGPVEDRDYGDAPEGAPAYPWMGPTLGAFPTCLTVGTPTSYIRHNNFGGWFGFQPPDFEPDGNAGLCPVFAPYDADECFMDGDAGLLVPEPFTIDSFGNPVPCPGFAGLPLGPVCAQAVWGPNIDIEVHNLMPNQTTGYVNVLIDWNQDGVWGGASTCPPLAPEHVLVDFPILNGYVGPLSGAPGPAPPPPVQIGPHAGYVWARFTFTEVPLGLGWTGEGDFEDGETEDYLLWVDGGPVEEFDWGDLPDPYATVAAMNGPNHLIVPNMALGAGVDGEPDGQPDPAAQGDDQDLMFPPPNDDEDGITFVTLLVPGQQAIIDVTNNMLAGGMGLLDGWIDFGADGSFAEAGDQVFFSMPLSPAPINFNSFFINVPPTAVPGATYARFRFSSTGGLTPVGGALDGEVEDYQVRIEQPPPPMACCLPDGSCVDTDYNDCVLNFGGDPQGPGTTCATVTCDELKWAQPPILGAPEHPECFWGWDELSRYGGAQIVADDWHCLDARPIADIHWWGSYQNWEGTEAPPLAPDRFHIGVWTDQPAGPAGEPSHPLTMIHEWIVPRAELNERPVGCDFHPDYMQNPDGCFRYDFDIPEDQWFYQEPGPTVYWISIAAIYEPVLCPCNGDLNGDGVINSLDQTIFASCVGAPPTGQCATADMDCDGDIDTQDLAIFLCWFNNCGGPNPDLAACQALCCPTTQAEPENPWGWKTRPHFFNDDAQKVTLPTNPVIGSTYEEGAVIAEGWDLAFVLTTREPTSPLVPKWSQLPHESEEGFDATSNIGLAPPEDLAKWQQLPNTTTSGLHAHDYVITGTYMADTLADQWRCEGSPVTKLVWYGNYELDAFNNEKRGAGIASFDVAIYDDDNQPMPFCLPNNLLWNQNVAFATLTEIDTGLTNNEGCTIYRYEYTLPNPFDQQQGLIYWLAIGARANDPNAPAIWRWQTDGPPTPNLCFAASKTDPTAPMWSSGQSELAFEIISAGPIPAPEPNRVVADDFVSDGRAIEAVRWWGSYLDDRYAPPTVPIEPFVLDGWLISFHHAVPETQCPPDALAGDDPTVLGVYFAPVDAVIIVPTGYADCLGHDVYGYAVDLSQCCLICAELDPRDGYVPADPDAFNEVRSFKYWLDIQAVVGVTWQPLTDPACVPIYTGHRPSDLSLEGHFWGWHTSPGPVAPCGPMNEACAGELAFFDPLTPPSDCPDYQNWQSESWQCPTGDEPVNMAFELLTREPDACATCEGDMDGNNVIDGRDIQKFVDCLTNPGLGWGQCACADVDCSKSITMDDIDEFVALLLSGTGC